MNFQNPEKARKALLELLVARDIEFLEETHVAVFTMRESMELELTFSGGRCKNLLVKNKKNTERFLIITTPSSTVDLGTLGRNLSVGRLSFCSSEEMKSLLGVEPGSASLLALMVDQKDKNVRVLMDKELEHVDKLLFHPFVNTSTMQFGQKSMLQFLSAIEHTLEVVTVPKRT